MLDYVHLQHRSDRRYLLILVLLLIVAAGVSLCAGDRWIGPESWWGPDGQLFVWQIRLPRTVAVMLVGAALALCGEAGLSFDSLATSYFIGRETLIPRLGTDMALWREKLFVAMFRNAGSATAFFQIPSNRVVELGTQVVL